MRISPQVNLYLSLLFGILTWTVRPNIIIACRCSDGIVIGSDSLSVSGILIGNRVSESVFKLGPNAVICCADGLSDFHHLLLDLKSFIRNADISHGGSVKTSSIARYARRLVNQKYRKTHLIIAGSDGSDSDNYGNITDTNSDGTLDNASVESLLTNDEIDIMTKNSSNTGARAIETTDHTTKNTNLNDIYTVHEILCGGTLISQNNALAGSGSDCVITLMDDLFPISGNGDRDGDFFYGTQNHLEKEKEKEKQEAQIHSNIFSSNRSNIGNSDKDAISLPSMRTSAHRVLRVLRAATGFDPRSGSHLRLWTFDRDGLKLI